jgi:hypothetical protein
VCFLCVCVCVVEMHELWQIAQNGKFQKDMDIQSKEIKDLCVANGSQLPQQLAFLASTSMMPASPAIPKRKRKRREDDSIEDDMVASRIKEFGYGCEPHQGVRDQQDIVASRIKEYGIKPGPGHSLIWEYFDKYKVGNDHALRTVGMCKICRNSQVFYVDAYKNPNYNYESHHV